VSPRARRFDEISAGGVVVRRGEHGWETCLVRVGNAWSLPKGIVEAGESPEQTALREISEEIGIPLDRLRLRGSLPASEYAYRRDGRLVFKRVDHFLVEVPPGTQASPQAGEIDEVAWVPLAGAAARITYRDLRAALDAAVRQLEDDA
jgi:8-oxo-dGTP pyrophosphatase MutT (NUDIX family)